MKRVKSKTFAVLLLEGERLGAYFLVRVLHETVELQEGASVMVPYLSIETCETEWGWRDQNNLIKMLVAAGVTVRFFDKEEKQWMQFSEEGYVQIPGNRDGSWIIPQLEDFERDYLGQ